MTEQTAVPAQADQETQVIKYLKQHPEFFKQHLGLLHHLHIPHQVNGAVSLVERQASLMRQRNGELQNQLHDLLEAARHNDLQFEKTKRLVLSLVEAHSQDEVVMALDEGLCQDFHGDLTRLILFRDQQGVNQGNLKILPLAEAESCVADLIESDWAICGSLTEPQRQFLFDDRAELVQSAAVIPLIKGHTQGLLAIGSFEANYFHSSMGTLFLNYVGEVLSRVLYRLDRNSD